MRFLKILPAAAVLIFAVSCSDSITLHNPPAAPVLGFVGPKTIDENSVIEFTLSAADSNGDALTFSADGLPPGALLDPSTGDFSWTPGYSDAGSYEVTFAVSDGGRSDSETSTITVNNVNRAPVLDPVGPRAAGENSEVAFTLTASDEDGETLSFGAANLPAGASLDPSTGGFSWTPGFSDTGSYEVTFTVSDGALEDSETVTITVGNVNRAPILDPVGPKNIDENSTLAFTLTGTDPDGDTVSFGSPNLPAGASLDPSTGEFSWTPGFSASGSYEVTFTVSDGSLEDSETVTITVGNVNHAPVLDFIGPKTVDENGTLSFTVSATDEEGDTLSYSISPVSANPAIGATIDTGSGQFTWTPGYSDAGVHDVTFVVSDGELTDTETVLITVGNVNRAPVLDFIGPQTVPDSGTVAFTITATDEDGDSLVFGAENLPGGATLDSNNGEFSWTPPVTGSYEVTFNVSDGSLEDWETVTITTAFIYPDGPDEYESDNSPDNATTLEIGKPQTHSIYPEGEEDWVRVKLVEGVRYQFTASHLSVNGDTWLYLYDTDGFSLLEDNDDCVGYDSCFEYTATASGYHYLAVGSYAIRGLMGYQLDFHPFVDNDFDGWSNFHDCNDNDPEINPEAMDIDGDGIDQNCSGTDALVADVPDLLEPDDTPETATPLVMAQGMQFEFIRRREFFPGAMHTLHDENDVDWFSVDIPPGRMMAVEALSNSSWPVYDSSFGAVDIFETPDDALRVTVGYPGHVAIANDSEETRTAFFQVVPGWGQTPPFSYVVYAKDEGYDLDQDGYGTMGMWGEHDCDDSDPNIYDWAFDEPGDGIDQDCDGIDGSIDLWGAPGKTPIKRRR